MNPQRFSEIFEWMPWWMKIFAPVFIALMPVVAWDEVGRYWSNPASFWLGYVVLWFLGFLLFSLAGGFLVAGLVATTVYRQDLKARGLRPRNRFPWESE
jgi:uncharacterized membrane protein